MSAGRAGRPRPGAEGPPDKGHPAGGDPDSSLSPERARSAQHRARPASVPPSAPELPRHEHPDKALSGRS